MQNDDAVLESLAVAEQAEDEAYRDRMAVVVDEIAEVLEVEGK